MDFKIWSDKYRKHYPGEIAYYNEQLESVCEKSPTFESMSRSVQTRGFLLKEEFVSICEWKTVRARSHYQKNDEEIVQETTMQIIREHPNTIRQLNELVELKGVGVPVASAILTVIYPTIYCIVDFRVWNSLLWLEYKKSSFDSYSSSREFIDSFRKYDDINSYIKYLDKIRNLSNDNNMAPRDIEMALWQFDKNRGILED